MSPDFVTPFEWFFLFSLIFIAIVSLYQACLNLFYGRVSSFSMDAILVFLFVKCGTEKARKRVRAFTKNVDRIMLFGIYALLSFVGAVYAIIGWLQRIVK